MSNVQSTTFGQGKLLPSYYRFFKKRTQTMEYHKVEDEKDELLVSLQLFHQTPTLIRKTPQVLVIQDGKKVDITILKGGTIKHGETGEVLWTYTPNSLLSKFLKSIKSKLNRRTTDGEIHQ